VCAVVVVVVRGGGGDGVWYSHSIESNYNFRGFLLIVFA